MSFFLTVISYHSAIQLSNVGLLGLNFCLTDYLGDI
jgi:hypothetical protein